MVSCMPNELQNQINIFQDVVRNAVLLMDRNEAEFKIEREKAEAELKERQEKAKAFFDSLNFN